MWKAIKKMFSLNSIIAILIVSFVMVSIYRHGLKYNNTYIEGFEEPTGKFELKNTIETIYDPFYVEIYDELCNDKGKHQFEIDHIIDKTGVDSKSKILDIGSGTGHTVNTLANHGCDVVGIDKSQSMCEKSKQIYPSREFKNEDALTSIAFDVEEFSHITCLYFTLYYVEDKRTFFKNCYDWLKPGGFMIVHLVNQHMFDPVLPPGNPLQSVNAQKYAPERITKTEIVFKKYNYSSEFIVDDKKDGKTKFVEIFSSKNKKTPFRKNVHTLYMEDQSSVLSIAKQMGFIAKSKYDMTSCSYEYNFLYVLKKPH